MPLRIYDSFAILKLFQKEPNYRKVAALLDQDLHSSSQPLLQIINFGEIIYRTKKDFGEEAKIRAIQNVMRLGFKIVPASDAIVYAAAELKGSFAISYADAFLLATAISEKATIVTGDPEFKKVGSLAHIEWI